MFETEDGGQGTDGPEGGKGVRHVRSRREHRVLRSVALVTTAVVAFGASGATALVVRSLSNVEHVDNRALVAPEADRPPVAIPDPEDPLAGLPVNLVLIGSDDRSGVNEAIGGAEAGMRSDTTILLHVAADRSRVELVSIPRDLMVPIPSCTVTGGGTTRAATRTMFNEAFSKGWIGGKDLASAATCTQMTVEQVSGVRTDGFAVVDFAGFQAMVDALEGVPMCIPEDMRDEDANLDLRAGTQTLTGAQALSLARARHELSDGSDTYRMGRQQALLAAMTRSILTKNLLTDLPSLVRFLDAATSSLSISGGVDLEGLAFSLRSVRTESVTFLTIPSGPMPSDPARVVLSPAAADVWARIGADEPVVPAKPAVTPEVPVAPEVPGPQVGADGPAPPTATTDEPAVVDPLADRRPGQAITSADAKAAC
ncbi:LCP family protein [Oerskovia douganii]|uniref:LCP family protein n=1 Tax=Oerskovia douganii TaxID=2762210 RepID=UPI001D122B1D|nr:LCP family protein [Oerskovia douganii]